MTQWSKEDLYGKNTINKKYDTCSSCKFAFKYTERFHSLNYKDFDVDLTYCTDRGDDVDESDWCPKYERK